MTDLAQSGNAADKLSALQKEAEALKVRLEEDRQKLNDVTRKFCMRFLLLLLATTACLRVRIAVKSGVVALCWSGWLELLYVRLNAHNNISVAILRHFACLCYCRMDTINA